MDTATLLRRFIEEHSQEAFTELVRTHLDLVYSAALRQVGGNAHHAQDVAQLVFTDLAHKAPALLRHTSLTGWLYTSTHFAAAKLRRAEQRRQAREQEAHRMNEIIGSVDPAEPWAALRPVLDDAMHELKVRDREMLLLRFFEQHSLAEVGRHVGLSENAARMAVERALDKLHALLARRGVKSTASALAMALANQTVAAAPAGLVASISAAALTNAGHIGLALSLLEFMSTTKVIVAVAALGVLASSVAVREISAHREAETSLARARGTHAALAAEARASSSARRRLSRMWSNCSKRSRRRSSRPRRRKTQTPQRGTPWPRATHSCSAIPKSRGPCVTRSWPARTPVRFSPGLTKRWQ